MNNLDAILVLVFCSLIIVTAIEAFGGNDDNDDF